MYRDSKIVVKFNQILVPYDGSSCSKKAFDVALDLCKLTKSKIKILHCIEHTRTFQMELDPRVSEIDDEKERKKALQRMEKLVQKGEKQGVKVTKEVTKTIEVAPKLEEYSKLRSTDLIIMGSHGRTGLKKLAFGNVANELVPRSKCPVMVVN